MVALRVLFVDSHEDVNKEGFGPVLVGKEFYDSRKYVLTDAKVVNKVVDLNDDDDISSRCREGSDCSIGKNRCGKGKEVCSSRVWPGP